MLTFWLIAAAMTMAALVLLLRPLLRASADPQRGKLAALEAAHAAGVLDDAEFQRKREAIASEAAPGAGANRAPVILAVALAVLVPTAALLLYRLQGEPRGMDPAALAGSGDSATSAPALEDAITGLAQRLEENPDDLEGWLLLGRAYKSMQRFEEAKQALAKARALDPQNPDAMVEYAEALALAAPDRRLGSDALQLLEQALSIDPAQQRGLWLLGIAHVQGERYPEAVLAWEKLLAQLPPESDVAASVREQIAEARARGGLPDAAAVAQAAPAGATPAAADPPHGDGAAAGGPRLTVQIELSPELAAKLTPNDVLFVFARAPQGPKMPLAIQRLPAPSFPLTVTLDDSMGMMPSLKLSQAAQVVVGARVSRTGIANAQSGDFEVISAPLAPAEQATPIRLLIDKVLP